MRPALGVGSSSRSTATPTVDRSTVEPRAARSARTARSATRRAATTRAVSRSSIRISRTRRPVLRASSQATRAVRRLPRCSAEVGLGAKRPAPRTHRHPSATRSRVPTRRLSVNGRPRGQPQPACHHRKIRAHPEPRDLPADGPTIRRQGADPRGGRGLRTICPTRLSSAPSNATRTILRAMGVPVETGSNNVLLPRRGRATGSGARTSSCRRSSSPRPRPRRSASRPGSGSPPPRPITPISALAKLRAAGVDPDPSRLRRALAPSIGAREPAFEPLGRRPVTGLRSGFDYRGTAARRSSRGR